MSKHTNDTRTCADCLHCLACHLWSSGAISDSVAPKCPQFKPARYASLAELQDLYRMYKGELAPVVHARWVKHPPFPAKMEEFHAKGIGLPMGVNSIYWTCSECGTWGTPIDNYCPNCGAKMDGGASDGT